MVGLSTSVAERFAVLGRELSIPVFHNASRHTWRSCLHDFLADSSRSPEFRAGVAYLGFNSVYPLQHQFEPLMNLVALGQINEALSRLESGAHDRRTRTSSIVTPPGPLVDITRYSGERAISGIPRVVRNLILSPRGQTLHRVVWAGGRLGPVEVDPDTGAVRYPVGQWRRGNQRARFGHGIVQSLRSIAMTSPLTAFAVFNLARWIPVPAVVLNVRHPEPRCTVLLKNVTLVIAEVMSREVADRLTTWQRVGTGLTTRMVIHDFLPLTHSEFFSPNSTHEHLLNVHAAAASERVFVATPLLAHEFERHCSTIGKAVPPTDVVPLPTHIPARSRRTTPRPSSPYVVFMGGFEERKRLQAFIDYTLAYRDESDSFRVIIVGKPPLVTNRNELSLVQRIVRNRNIFSLVSGLTDDELADLVAGALATVYVSSAEGYGLPIVESLAAGTPVIAARTPVNTHLNDLYGGVLMTFDATHATVTEIRNLHKPAYRNRVVRSIRPAEIPHDITQWADRVLRGIA
jgi:glycosyltransferase involved in cell wall biosynthesis